VVGYRGAALFPGFLVGLEAALRLLPTIAGQRIRVDVKPVRPGLSALRYVAFHAASLSVSIKSRSLAEIT
jgi:hypothetical protein